MPFHITASHTQIVLLEFSLVASFFYCLIHHWFIKVEVWEEGAKVQVSPCSFADKILEVVLPLPSSCG